MVRAGVEDGRVLWTCNVSQSWPGLEADRTSNAESRNEKLKMTKIRWLLISCICALSFASLHPKVGGVQEEDEIKDLTRTSWTRKRPRVSTRPVNARYKITQRMPKTLDARSVAEDSEIGVTLWRLRLARSDDAVEIKELVQGTKGAPKEEWTPERVTADAPFEEGQMVRLSIESLRTGFLYVINRAKFKDGTYGDPYLIFPTRQIYGGNNRVEAGRTIQIPGPDEQPFTLERGKSKAGDLQVSEELIVLVTAQPLESFLVPPANRQKLTTQSVESLIQKYATAYEVAQKLGGVGHAITIAEKGAANTIDKRLSNEDPYPQTIYRLARKPNETMLLKFELQVRSKEPQ